MKARSESRRQFLKAASLTAGAVLLFGKVVAKSGVSPQRSESPAASESSSELFLVLKEFEPTFSR